MKRFLLVVLLAASSAVFPVAQRPPAISADRLGGLTWRQVGPAMFAGRVADVDRMRTAFSGFRGTDEADAAAPLPRTE